MVLVILLMWGLTGSNFMNLGNFQSMAYQMPELGILTLAMMIAMLTSGSTFPSSPPRTCRVLSWQLS